MVFKVVFVMGFLRRVKMGTNSRYTFTKPKQMPLFEEEDDGSLKEYKKDE